VQSAPRPPASVSLGGSLRASRAAQLARPSGPLAAVDLADGRALLAELRGAVWIEVEEDASTLELPALPGAEPPASVHAPARARRLGVAAVLAAAFGATAVALATGFSGAPAPAVASPGARPAAARAPASPRPPAVVARPRGGRAVVPRSRPAAPASPAPPAAPAPAAAIAPPAAVAPQAPPPAPPPLPELPAAPAL
jgi:hypothetical protein